MAMTHTPKEQDIRKQFFVYRNGILADALRGAGNCHTMIFGLTLQQIIEIAKGVGEDLELAKSFWQDVKCREARLIAPMLMPCNDFVYNDAIAWCESVEDYEVCDVLCFRLLRNLSFANELVRYFIHSHQQLRRYLALRLLLNLIILGKWDNQDEAIAFAKEINENDAVALRQVSKLILDSILIDDK